MTTEQTAQQLELAAQILRTGHPWEYRVKKVDGEEWHDGKISDVSYYAHYSKIRPVLATPPDNRPLHNPDNLTAEQVGVGYRLTIKGESPRAEAECYFFEGGWKCREKELKNEAYLNLMTYRLPLSVPWPEPADPYAELKAAHAAGKVIQYRPKNNEEWSVCHLPRWSEPLECYRIKPESTFQLPPPPPGMRWHREDGWKADDLPSGYRPLVVGETLVRDEPFRYDSGLKDWVKGIAGQRPENNPDCFFSTTRPLTFEHAGKTWAWHRPGDPMPCDGDSSVNILCRDEQCFAPSRSLLAKNVNWDECYLDGFDVLGWRYADEKKTVPLGPEDVMPGSVFRLAEPEGRTPWIACVLAMYQSVELSQSSRTFNVTYEKLLEEWQINRSIPLTGKWNPDAWEPCSKTIPADDNLAEPKSR